MHIFAEHSLFTINFNLITLNYILIILQAFHKIIFLLTLVPIKHSISPFNKIIDLLFLNLLFHFRYYHADNNILFRTPAFQ